MTKMRELKSAIIGLGSQAEEDWIPGMSSCHLACLEAICDTDKSRLQKVEEETQKPAYTDFKAMLDETQLDFVIASTPHDIYPEIIRECAKRGIHVFKEKPFARNLSEAKDFKEIAEQSKIHVMTNVQRRFNPIFNSFFQLADYIGKPHFIDAHYALAISNPTEGWRASKSIAGGGAIIDMGYHMADMIIWYFGLPTNVSAYFTLRDGQEVENDAIISFSYDDGLIGSLRLSRAMRPKQEYIRLLASDGSVHVERGKITRFTKEGETVESLSREQGWPIAAGNQIDYFCKIIKGEKENMCGPDYHLQHLAFIEAAYRSCAENINKNPHELLALPADIRKS